MRDLPQIEVPWPHKDLHPNARGHWGKRSRETKKARAAAAWSARAAEFHNLIGLDDPAVKVTAIFIPPDNRRRDIDGMISSIKPTLDGIADVLGIDDSRFVLTARREDPRPPGIVRIELEIVGKGTKPVAAIVERDRP